MTSLYRFSYAAVIKDTGGRVEALTAAPRSTCPLHNSSREEVCSYRPPDENLDRFISEPGAENISYIFI